MATEPENLILEIQRKIQARQADHDRQLGEIKVGLARIEREVNPLQREGAGRWIEPVETRFDLRDA